MADNSTMANALAVIARVLSTGTSTPQQSSSKPSQKNLEVSKLGTVPAPSVPGSVETAGYNVNSARITR